MNWDTEKYDDLICAMTNIEEEKVLSILKDFIDGEPSREEEELIMDAMKNGISAVVHKYEMKSYTISDLMKAREILSTVMKMIENTMQIS